MKCLHTDLYTVYTVLFLKTEQKTNVSSREILPKNIFFQLSSNKKKEDYILTEGKDENNIYFVVFIFKIKLSIE